MGKFTKRLTTGLAALMAMSFGASASILIDDFASGSNENAMGFYWYYYTNLATKSGNLNEWNNGRYIARDYSCADALRESITVDPAQIKGTLGTSNYQILFRPMAGAGMSGGNAAVLEFSDLDAELDPCYPGVGMGTNLTRAPNPDKPIGPDNPEQLPVGTMFNGVTHISFWAKVSHEGLLSRKVKFKVETAEQLRHIDEPGATPGTSTTGSQATSKKEAMAANHAPLLFDAVDTWKQFNIAVTGASTIISGGTVGDLMRDTWETHTSTNYTFNINDAVKIAWYIQGQDWASPPGEKVRLYIDDVRTTGGNWERPGVCKDCHEAAQVPSGDVWLLSDFDQEVFQPTDGSFPYRSQNRLGGPWYAFTDALDAPVPSDIVMGTWYDPQYLVDANGKACDPENAAGCTQGGAGLNIDGVGAGQSVNGIPVTPDMIIGEDMEGNSMGHNSSAAPFIAFNMGPGWIDSDGEAIRGFVGIGTKLSEDENGTFNAAAPGLTGPGAFTGDVKGVWFMYRTVGMNHLVVSVVDQTALNHSNPASATRSVRIAGTNGQWMGARITWDKFAPPSWSNWTTPLDLTKLVELQFRHEADQGTGSITIDNVYLIGANLGAPQSVKRLSSKAAVSAMRASYSRGSVNVNWNAPSNISSGKISLVNIKGATVASQPVKASGSKISAKLATKGALPTGMYFVRIDARDVNGKRVVQQVPVNIVK